MLFATIIVKKIFPLSSLSLVHILYMHILHTYACNGLEMCDVTKLIGADISNLLIYIPLPAPTVMNQHCICTIFLLNKASISEMDLDF